MQREYLPVELVTQYLEGLVLPAGKEEIMRCARANAATANALQVLERLPAQPYRRLDDIRAAITRVI